MALILIVTIPGDLTNEHIDATQNPYQDGEHYHHLKKYSPAPFQSVPHWCSDFLQQWICLF